MQRSALFRFAELTAAARLGGGAVVHSPTGTAPDWTDSQRPTSPCFHCWLTWTRLHHDRRLRRSPHSSARAHV